MVTVRDIDKYLSEISPKELSESWDNDGVMICSEPDKKVKKVLVALDVTGDVIEYAAKGGFDLIVSHHPFIFRKLSRITGFEYKNLETLIKNDISVLSYHTRLDSAQGGVNDVLAQTIGLSDVRGFGGDRGDFGRVGTLPREMTGEEFAHYLKEKLMCDVRCAFNDGKMVKTVAVLGGSGKDFVYDAMLCGADAYVTSEIPHNLFIDAKVLDFALYDCGHYYTENPVCEKIKTLLIDKFSDVEVEIFDTKSPYVTY
ncbi:MAG: Nif3-like dinuclear metal center hexameric protein [Clostridia bacterium]|nr:Nif3-like dinuclear metal center hexameric protein [Clostridia bacterium]